MLRLMVMRRAVLVLLLLAVSACGSAQADKAGSERTEASGTSAMDGPPSGWLASVPYAEGAVVGETYEGYWLTTHCGVNGARVDGAYWDATNGSARRDGWADPYQQGTLRMTGEDTAVFTSGEQTVEFVRTAAADYPPCA